MSSPAGAPRSAEPRRGRPPSPAKRQAILTAATDVFLREGYEQATLDVIAAAAGVSKQTIYSHFTDKESLFVAVLNAIRSEGGAPAIMQGRWRLDPADVRGSLTAFGEALLATILDAKVSALRRVMIAELGRRPSLRELWNTGAPDATVTQFATELTALTVQGVLSVPDVPQAVEQFFALLGHPANNRSLYGVMPLSTATRHNIAASAADMFVRAYQPQP